jgi:hypothetical protein
MVALLLSGIAAGDVQPRDCRAIADPAARLVCYDAGNTAPAPAPRAERPAPAYRPPASVETASRSGRIAAVERLRHGRHRVTLDDGRRYTTSTNTAAPPRAGQAVTLRRSALGTTFLDIRGRDPITVRPAPPLR